MKTQGCFILNLFSIVICQTRLDFNSEACNNYLQKFGTAESINGIGPSSLSFTGEVELPLASSQLLITLRYSDPLFDDVNYWGLTQEDGKTPETACLDLKLFKFSGSHYTDPIQVTDLPFTASASSDWYNKWRYLSFSIDENEFPTRLFQISSSNTYIYIGFYAIAYYAAETTQIQYTFYFEFSVTVSKVNKALLSATFAPFNQQETFECTISASYSTCSAFQTPQDLKLFDSFYIQQKVIQPELQHYYLSYSTVLLIGDGLIQQIRVGSIDDSKPGQLILELFADVLWTNLQILVRSYLTNTQKFFDPVSGGTEAISCIKNRENQLCPTCADQCNWNFLPNAVPECLECPSQGLIRLDIHNKACGYYLKKLGKYQSDSTSQTSLPFFAEAAISPDSSVVVINLSYFDSLYTDETYWGLSMEDGKISKTTCLDIFLYCVTLDMIRGVYDLNLKASSDLISHYRSLSISMNRSHIEGSFQRSSNSHQLIYTGIYILQYYLVDKFFQSQYEFSFKISLLVSKKNGTFVQTYLVPIYNNILLDCQTDNTCTLQPQSELIWCTDASCQNNIEPNLSFNDFFYIQQIVTTPELNNYYLTNTIVSFIGDELDLQIKPISIDNSQPSKVTIYLQANIVWSNFNIQVVSYLSNTLMGNRILEEKVSTNQTKYDPIAIAKKSITCIKINPSQTSCPTCADECQTNGFARKECIECQDRIEFNSDECKNYLKKFKNITPENDTGQTYLSYTAIATYETEKSNIIIMLWYYDPLYDDAIYWGLSQEDGKMIESTCLNLKLWKFRSPSFDNPVQVTDLAFTASLLQNLQIRELKFTIKKSDFATRLVQSVNSNQYIHNGYYAIAYYSATKTEQIQYTFYFQFSVTSYKSNGTIISTTLQPFNQFETVDCLISSPCNITYSSSVKWCTDVTCSVNTIPNLFYQDQFYIQQVVTSSSFSDYYLVYTVVTLIGDGLNIMIEPIMCDYSKPGQVTLLLQINYVWSNLSILVTSFISTPQYALLTVSGMTETIPCIKMNSDSTTCPTCGDECKINRFSRSVCKECHDRLDSESFACSKYKKKFDHTDSDIVPTTLSFTGDTIVATGNQDVIVSLRYSDSLSTDATYFGLTQEDGKIPEATCLDLKLWKYSDNFTDPVEITDLPIKGDKSKKYRFLNFTINGTDFTTRLIQSANSDYYTYNGYYAIGYDLALSDLNIYTFYFQFSVTVSKLNKTIVSTFFKPLNQWETQNCSISGPCNVSPSSELKWCTDASCSINTIPNLYLFDQFYLQQTVTIKGLKNYYLINTTVYYIGNGLIKQTKPIKINNNQPGKVLLLLNADVAWSNIRIQVISYISTTSKGTRLLTESDRLLATQTIIYDPVLGITEPITCIKMIPYDTCPSCVDECQINGFAKEGCECSNINNTKIPDYQIPNIDSLLNIIIIIYLII